MAINDCSHALPLQRELGNLLAKESGSRILFGLYDPGQADAGIRLLQLFRLLQLRLGSVDSELVGDELRLTWRLPPGAPVVVLNPRACNWPRDAAAPSDDEPVVTSSALSINTVIRIGGLIGETVLTLREV